MVVLLAILGGRGKSEISVTGVKIQREEEISW
jgi:hypothetical protein